MNDAEGRAVRFAHPVGIVQAGHELGSDAQRQVEGEKLPAPVRIGEDVCEISPPDVLHGNKDAPIYLT